MRQTNDLLLFGKRCKCLAIVKLAVEAPVEARRGGCKRAPVMVQALTLRSWLG